MGTKTKRDKEKKKNRIFSGIKKAVYRREERARMESEITEQYSELRKEAERLAIY